MVDHIQPLKRGGADDPSNMQWQTVEDAKAKDRWEDNGSTSSMERIKCFKPLPTAVLDIATPVPVPLPGYR